MKDDYLDYDFEPDFWEREEERSQINWENSKDKMYVVRMNMGGLEPNVIEARHTEGDEDGEYWDKSGNISYGGRIDETKTNKVIGFKRKKDAENFLAGVKFFRDFMCRNYFAEEILIDENDK